VSIDESYNVSTQASDKTFAEILFRSPLSENIYRDSKTCNVGAHPHRTFDSTGSRPN